MKLPRAETYTDISTNRWEPWTGCTKASEGCRICWAEVSLNRLKDRKISPFYEMDDPFKFRMVEEELGNPKMANMQVEDDKPERVWVCDRSDPFYDRKVDGEYLLLDEKIIEMFDVLARFPEHRYIICTKRSKRMLELDSKITWRPWMWAGVTVESEEYMYRIDDLKACGAQRKMLQFEPLIGRIPKFDPTGIDFISVGGEAGAKARPMEEEWVLELLDIANSANIPFLFKSWSSYKSNKRRGGNRPKTIHGKTYDELPAEMLTNEGYLDKWKKNGD